MNDLQILILTLFLGLFLLLANYLIKFFRSAAKSAEDSQALLDEKSSDDGTFKQVRHNILNTLLADKFATCYSKNILTDKDFIVIVNVFLEH